eukprot:SAG31_NODE_1695_length_7508_cov_2.975030_7_plen_81_part_00
MEGGEKFETTRSWAISWLKEDPPLTVWCELCLDPRPRARRLAGGAAPRNGVRGDKHQGRDDQESEGACGLCAALRGLTHG